MKYTLTFETDDKTELDEVHQGLNAMLVLHAVDTYLRNIIKYDPNYSEAEKDIYYKVREKLYQIANEYNVEI